jgi:hypothetical protein
MPATPTVGSDQEGVSLMGELDGEVSEHLPVSRRNFFIKLVAIGFAVPVVSSFAIDSVASADTHTSLFNNLGGSNITLGGDCIEVPVVPHGHDRFFERFCFSNLTTFPI